MQPLLRRVLVLLVTGPVGVGKSSVASEVSELLDQAGVAHALVDVDSLRWCYPRRSSDPFRIELAMNNLVPEVTVNLDGVYWHPLSTEPDMQVSKKLFPLRAAVERIQGQLDELARTGTTKLMDFK